MRISRRSLVAAGALLLSPTAARCAPAKGSVIFPVELFTDLPQTRVPAGVPGVRTTGHHRRGPGAAFYRRVGSGPATPWRARSADGQWFELDEPEILAGHLGAVGYPVASVVRAGQDYRPSEATGDAAEEHVALQTWLEAAAALGRPARLDPGRAFRVGAGLKAPAESVILGDGAALATTAAVDVLGLGDGCTVRGLLIVGAGPTFRAGGRGVVCWGREGRPGSDPVRLAGPVLEDVQIRGVGREAVSCRYTSGGLLARCHIHGVGYIGSEALSADDLWLEDCLIETLEGEDESGEENAYGATWTRNTHVADLTAAPPSRGGGAKRCVIRDIPTWHGLDAHGADGVHWAGNRIENCRRAAVLTHGTHCSSSNCRVEGTRAVNRFPLSDRNRNGTEKRELAFADFGLSRQNPARGNVWIDNECVGYGARDINMPAILLSNTVDVTWRNNREIDSVRPGVRLEEAVTMRDSDMAAVSTG